MKLPKNLLTIYGRNPVLEALENKKIKIYALHLSKSNKPSLKLEKIINLATQRNIPIKYHTKKELSFISKNQKQDQGVALDIIFEQFIPIEAILKKSEFTLLALENITNPQNVGMIIRSATAAGIDALLLQQKGNASLVSPLTIKASAGTIFKIPIIMVNNIYKTLETLKENNTEIVSLDLKAKENFFHTSFNKRVVFVLGNETNGVSSKIKKISTKKVIIPMQNEVESLNVAITAALIGFCIKNN